MTPGNSERASIMDTSRAKMSGTTTGRLKALLAEVLAADVALPGDLGERIDAALTRRQGGHSTGRKSTLDAAEVKRRREAGESVAVIAADLQVSREAIYRLFRDG